MQCRMRTASHALVVMWCGHLVQGLVVRGRGSIGRPACRGAGTRGALFSAAPTAADDRGEAAFASWLAEALADAPNREAYGSVYDEGAACVVRWRRRYPLRRFFILNLPRIDACDS